MKRQTITILFYSWLLAQIAIAIAVAVHDYPSRLWWLTLLIIPVPVYYVVKTVRLFGWFPR